MTITDVLSRTSKGLRLGLFPSVLRCHRARDRASEAIGLVGLGLLAFGLVPSKSAQTAGLFLMSLSAMWNGSVLWGYLKRDPVFALLVVWLSYSALRTGAAAWQYPGTAAAQLDYLGEYVRLAGVLVTGWWLGGSARAVKSAAGLALAGLLLFVIIELGVPGLLSGLPARHELSVNAQHLGLVALTTVIALVALPPRWRRSTGDLAGALLVAGWLLGLLVALVLLFLSGSRTVWALALGAALVMLGLQAYRALSRRSARQVAWSSVIALGVAVVVVGGVVAANHERAVDRVTHEAAEYRELLKGNFRDIDSLSMGSRIDLWRLGLDRFLSRPVFGWGPAMPAVLIKLSGLPDETRSRFDHLHNSYLETAVALGTVGLLLYVAIWVVLLVGVRQALRRGTAEGAVVGFVMASVLVFLLASMTEAYVVRQLGWSYTALLGGMLYSLAMGGRLPDNDPAQIRAGNAE